jgi:hemerythrin superfamily protein
MAEQQDGIDLLIHDHREVEQLFQRFETGADDATRKQLVEQITTELSKHAAAEEQYLYPLTAEAVAGGADLAEHSVEEHQEMKDTLHELQGMDATDPAYGQRVQELIAEVRHHVEEEEGELFPKLRQAVGEDRIMELGQQLATAKKMAPTQPHPKAPNTPPANKVAGPIAGAVDRITGKG